MPDRTETAYRIGESGAKSTVVTQLRRVGRDVLPLSDFRSEPWNTPRHDRLGPARVPLPLRRRLRSGRGALHGDEDLDERSRGLPAHAARPPGLNAASSCGYATRAKSLDEVLHALTRELDLEDQRLEI